MSCAYVNWLALAAVAVAVVVYVLLAADIVRMSIKIYRKRRK